MARVEFALPDVGEGLDEGEIVSWLVHPGDRVARDQPLVEVQTDKALVELPSPVAGEVVALAFAPGDIVKVGQVLVVLEDSASSPAPTAAPPSPSAPPRTAPVPTTASPSEDLSTGTGAAGPTRPERAPSEAPTAGAGATRPTRPERAPSEAPTAGAASSGPAGPEEAASAPTAGTSRAVVGARVGGRPKAAPAVRKLAVELGVDLTTVTGTGPGGRVLAADVEAAARATATGVLEGGTTALRNASSAPPATGATESGPTSLEYAGSAHATGVPEGGPTALKNAGSPPTTTSVPEGGPTALKNAGSAGIGWMEAGRHPLRGIRRVTAEAMARSWSEIPHLTTMDEVDATGLLAARRRLGQAGIDTTIGGLLVAAVARGLRRFPVLNASIGDGEIVVHPDCNIGLAVATADGLVVPVIRSADRRSLGDLAAEVRRLTAAARNRRVELADLQGGTFTVSNYGSLGGRFATPLIRPPEVGIMGFGSIRPRPFVVDGKVEARPTLPWSLSADHRLIDGNVATAFAEYVTGLLADPVALLAELLGAIP